MTLRMRWPVNCPAALGAERRCWLYSLMVTLITADGQRRTDGRTMLSVHRAWSSNTSSVLVRTADSTSIAITLSLSLFDVYMQHALCCAIDVAGTWMLHRHSSSSQPSRRWGWFQTPKWVGTYYDVHPKFCLSFVTCICAYDNVTLVFSSSSRVWSIHHRCWRVLKYNCT